METSAKPVTFSKIALVFCKHTCCWGTHIVVTTHAASQMHANDVTESQCIYVLGHKIVVTKKPRTVNMHLLSIQLASKLMNMNSPLLKCNRCYAPLTLHSRHAQPVPVTQAL
jgi:hypothetical protein